MLIPATQPTPQIMQGSINPCIHHPTLEPISRTSIAIPIELALVPKERQSCSYNLMATWFDAVCRLVPDACVIHRIRDPVHTAVVPTSVDSARAARQDLLDLEEVPLLVAERAGGARLEPPLDAVQVEDVAAASPGYAESWVVSIPCGVRLHPAQADHQMTLTSCILLLVLAKVHQNASHLAAHPWSSDRQW